MDFKSIVSTKFHHEGTAQLLQNLSMYNNTKDFDFDLSRGNLSEKQIGKILQLDKDKFETKSEFGFWQKSGNLCIELEYKGRPSGLKGTKAKYWVHRFMSDDETCIGQIIIEVRLLKKIVRKFISDNKNQKYKIIRMLGDGYNSKCVLIPMSTFLDLWRFI